MAGSCGARGLLSVLTWLVSPIVLGCLVVLLVFWLIVVQGQRLRFKREKSKLRVEFDSYRREMQVKVRRPGPDPLPVLPCDAPLQLHAPCG